MRHGQFLRRLAAGALLAAAVPAGAATRAAAIAVRAGPLSAALHELARQTRTDLFFDEDLVRGARAPALRGTLTFEAAVRRLLSGTGLRARRAAPGAYVIERLPLAPATPQPIEPEPPIAEILVIGKRTQNSDIRRRQNDVQPYQVSTGREVVRSHRDNVDQFFRSRVTANTQVIPPSLLDDANSFSEIDLRGLGPDSTVVLVDGRRMPRVPLTAFGFRQSDVNAIPLHAIERIETLTGTAGGIHGFGALGGVANIILRREYRGAELHVTAGISSRGDALHKGLEGRLGFTPDQGRTDVMIYLSHHKFGPLFVGERNYRQRDQQRSFELVPEQLAATFPTGDSVGVFSFSGGNLTFKPEFGGGNLGSERTFLPSGFSGTAEDLVASLTERAGLVDTSIPQGERATQLGSNAEASAALINLRHRFTDSIEGYLDAVILRNEGQHTSRASTGQLILRPSSPENPFEQFLFLTFPAPPRTNLRRATFTSERYTGGLVASLPLGWRGTAEATIGSARVRRQNRTRSQYGADLFQTGVDPFGNWEDFQAALTEPPTNSSFKSNFVNRYSEQSLRLAGPVFRTPGGLATLTLLAERRRERVPAHSDQSSSQGPDTDVEFESPSEARSTRSSSWYAELRSRLFDHAAPLGVLRNAEIQLAARYDREKLLFSSLPFQPEEGEIVRRSFKGTAYTAGGKTFPFPWLMIRASYATGAQPPPPSQLLQREEFDTFPVFLDPKRGNNFVFFDGPVLIKSQGFLELKTARASTLSFGAVLTPGGDAGPRISLDYSRICRDRDVYTVTPDLVVDQEDFWPERVTREPLSDADRALGFTAGRIIAVDARASNAGALRVQSIDGRFDWTLPFLQGSLRAYGSATLQMRNRLRNLFGPDFERAGYRSGPLKWRANAGVDWTAGRLTLGANVQHFARYRIYDAEFDAISEDLSKVQGSEWVPSQTYLDLHASRRFLFRSRSRIRELSLELGIVNVLDEAPPRESDITFLKPGYSRYGDPRRRRIQAVLSSSF